MVMFRSKICLCYFKNMEEVHLLLKEINLEALYGVFKKEEITLQVLLEMGHEQLSSVGITKFGHRQKIITAAREREGKTIINISSIYCYKIYGLTLLWFISKQVLKKSIPIFHFSKKKM